ncbi:MAG TPA: 2Fe-2S iron-sulfur cluster-binding protein [bacterium]|nr:2Fe-2S iron-sulfur cluster-binding protein [bacterium]
MASDVIVVTLDGKKRRFRRGQSVLEGARASGAQIPTLCYHEALEAVGACRLCVVEVTQGGRTRTMASCVTPAEDGMIIATATPHIVATRKMIMMLLLARCPTIDVIKRLAREMGIKTNPFPKGDEDCFLCGMCVRACAEIVGVGAIGIAYRGPKSEVQPPFGQESNVCIGCGTCTTICPARTFDLAKVFARRSMHKVGGAPEIIRCTVCEDHYTGT